MDSTVLETGNFPPAGEDQWMKLVVRALKGATFEEALVSNVDGLEIRPLYPRSPGPQTFSRRRPDLPWIVSQRADDPDAGRLARQMADDLANGASGLSLVSRNGINAYGTGLDSVEMALFTGKPRSVRFEGMAFEVVLAMVEAAKRTGAQLHFGLDPFSLAVYGGGTPDITAIASRFNRLSQTGAEGTILNADARAIHNAGGTAAQELAFIAAAIADYLRIAEGGGIPPEMLFPSVSLCLPADQDQFLTIAKARAARLIFARLQEACGVKQPAAAHLAMETSYRMLTQRDPETNLLRNTIAAFAAGVGGADEISVLPHTLAHGLPDPLARRLARNIQTILIAESHLDHVADAAAGSGGLEVLTETLAAHAWTVFRLIEREGGLTHAISSGLIRRMIEEAEASRPPGPIVGTTLFPAPKERTVAVLGPLHRDDAARGLKPIRRDEVLPA